MRVVITGMGVISSLGNSVDEMFLGLQENICNIETVEDWKQLKGLNSHVGAWAKDFDNKIIPRKTRRAMSKMSEMAYMASIQALNQASLSFHHSSTNLNFTRTLVILGSTTGSPESFETYFKKYFEENGPHGQLATSFFKTMNHSVAANVAAGLEYIGPLLSTPSACSTSSHAIILGTELIKSGLYDVVLAGGADELHATSACIFDIVQAASTNYNNRPLEASRPFDKDRDGLVVSEGAGVVILESLDHAKKRHASILGEILGGAYLCDGSHMTQPQSKSMVATMQMALDRANILPSQVDYINAHATSTVIGDEQECLGISELFGAQTPVSSLKGHLGHTLAACGALEIIACQKMIEKGLLIPTRNLVNIDLGCDSVLVFRDILEKKVNTIVSNNFAFGGINTTIVLGSFRE
jgi:3-oxoacyl-[acyl-carrier-protein] synthase II